MEMADTGLENSVDRANRVELFSLPERNIIPAESRPRAFWCYVGDRILPSFGLRLGRFFQRAFWRHVGERILLNESDTQRVIHLFRELEPGMSARCHMPPWGLALYAGDVLLFTVTLCYKCGNAYVYTGHGMDRRAFNPRGPNAAALRQMLEQHLPLSE